MRSRARRGSLTVIAIIVLFILGVIILAWNWSAVSAYKMFYHSYYDEKSLALIDGLNALARGVVQQNLDTIIDNMKVGETSDLKGLIQGGLTSQVKDLAVMLELIDNDEATGRKTISPDIAVKVKLIAKDAFHTAPTTVINDDHEAVGKLEITVEVSYKGLGFQVPKKIVHTQHEFKRIRAVTPLFRHFSLFVKKAISKDEKEEDYADQSSQFNHLVNDRTGNVAESGGALFVQNDPGLQDAALPQVKDKKSDNPFYTFVPYIYLGGSGKAYLNLTAGGGGNGDRAESSVYGEDFQLYRTDNPDGTDFYRVVSTEFYNFIEKAPAIFAGDATSDANKSVGRKILDFFKSVVARIGDFVHKAVSLFRAMDDFEASHSNLPSTNAPLYYIVRKDYGYAKEWGETPAYKKFGFGNGPVLSSSLHLWNARDDKESRAEPTPTVVLGNIYRRCLSLSGYKQRRAGDLPTKDRKFEVQAGPIEYFKDIDDLFNHVQDPTQPADKGPIWVWDNRVNWDWHNVKRGTSTESSDSTGTFLPISGPALFGRIVPGLQRLWDDDKSTASKLFGASIAPPDEIVNIGNPITGAGDVSKFINSSDVEEIVLVSPLFALVDQVGGFNDFQDPAGVDSNLQSGLLFGIFPKLNSPYFEELMRAFAYSSAGIPDEAKGQLKDLEKKAVEHAGGVWKNVIASYKSDAGLSKIIQAIPPSSIADDKRRQLWTRDGPTPETNIFPFSLPDPWSDHGPFKIARNFESVFKSAVSNKATFFDKYFRPLMTNPGRAMPYNYSMRFWFKPLREVFAMNPKDRLKLLAKDVAPEVRDAAFGYLDEAGNDYLKPKPTDTTDPCLNDEALAAIYGKRSGDKALALGYFFMDDYGGATHAPKDASLDDVFKGDRYCWEEMTQQQFDDRFVKTAPMADSTDPREIDLGTVVKVKGLTLGPAKVLGGGCIISDSAPIRIAGDITSFTGPPLILKAPSFEIDRGVSIIQAVLVATKEFQFKGNNDCTIEGAVWAEAWDPTSWMNDTGARRRIRFNQVLKAAPERPQYLLNLEPRIRHYIVSGEAEK